MRDPTPAKVADMLELLIRDRVRHTHRCKVQERVELLTATINGRTFCITVTEVD